MSALEEKLHQVRAAEAKVGGFEWELGLMYGELKDLFKAEAHKGKFPSIMASKRAGRVGGVAPLSCRWDVYCRMNLRKRAIWVDGHIIAARRLSKEHFQRLGITKAVLLGRTAVEGRAFSELVSHALKPGIGKCELQQRIARAEEEQGLRRPLKGQAAFETDPYKAALAKASKLSDRQREELVRELLRSLPTEVQREVALEFVSTKVRRVSRAA
jgi:hypothetical protein